MEELIEAYSELTKLLKEEALHDMEIEEELFGIDNGVSEIKAEQELFGIDNGVSEIKAEQEQESKPEIIQKEKKIKEAMRRMERLHLMPEIIREFGKHPELVQYSEPTPFGGILYWIKNNPEWMAQVEEFERKTNSVVYHGVHTYTKFGELLSLLFVSDYEEEWEYDNEDLDDGYVMTYTINLDEPMFSGYGSIAVKPAMGGLIRIR